MTLIFLYLILVNLIYSKYIGIVMEMFFAKVVIDNLPKHIFDKMMVLLVFK